MARLSITTAWNETASFVKQEAGPLFLISFALMALPAIILQALLPRVIVPTGNGGAGLASTFSYPQMGWLLLLIIPVFLLSLWGNLTINILALRREAVIGAAFGRASGRILPLLGAGLLLTLGGVLLALPIVFLFAGAAASGGGGLGAGILVFIVVWLVFVFVAIRLMLITPVAAGETGGPIAIIKRSWELSSGHFWKLFGFFLLLMLVMLVVMMAIGALAGILIYFLAGPPEPGSIASFANLLVAGIIQAVFGAYFAVMLARIYEQLAGGALSTAEVFQ
jgi:hypothetical protein